MDVSAITAFLDQHVDLYEPNLAYVAVLIVLAPVIWNAIGHFEYHTHGLSKLFGQYGALYLLAAWIFSFSLYRDYVFEFQFVPAQPQLSWMKTDMNVQVASWCLIGIGQLFVWSSFYRLGVSGTFLGAELGILMEEKVTSFPFSVLHDPMYVGSTMTFLGSAMMQGSVAGMLMCIHIWVVYWIAVKFVEGPFVHMIYSEAHKKSWKQNKGKAKGSSKKPKSS